jgi:aminopeptidase N
MLRRTLLATALVAPALGACATSDAPSTTGETLPPDPDSYALPNEARVTHVSLDLVADFERRVMRGAATLTIRARPGIDSIVLDTLQLNIASIHTNLGDTAWSVGEHRDRYGAPLRIAIAPGVETITIAYESGPGAASLQWLEPAQTASNKRFLFSQGQSILNRTWIPTQDSPGIRQTYDARIVAPEGLVAVMSAEMLTPGGEPAEGGRAFRFRMPQPIPPYLIALAIGDLAHRDVGPRTGVWAEPSVVDTAAREFDDMPHMMQVAEALYGDYRWGRSWGCGRWRCRAGGRSSARWAARRSFGRRG